MEHKLRERLRNIIRKKIEKRGWPRVIVSVILLFSGGIGVFSSFLLLHGGVETMWFRYLLSMLAGYCSFFLAIRIWMFFIQRQKNSIGPDTGLDGVVDIPLGGFPSSSGTDSNSFIPGGGKFGGGGSEGSWGSPLKSSSSSSSGRGGKGGFSLDLDLDELLAVIFFIAAILVLLCAAFYVIYTAPVLLTELIVDSILLTGAYKKVNHADPKSWIGTTFRGTIIPFTITLIMFVIAGIMIQNADPEAKSVGDFFNHIMQE